MAKKKSKFDAAKIKQFLITHGERVALGAAGLFAFWLIVGGLLAAVSSSSPAPDIKKAAEALDGRVRTSHPPSTETDKLGERLSAPEWSQLASLEPYATVVPYFDPAGAGESKLSNPVILAIPSNIRDEETNKLKPNFQVDIVRAPVIKHELDTSGREVYVLSKGKTTDLTKAPLARNVDGRQMVIVSATLAYEEQLELIRKALRKPTISSLLSDKDTRPKWIGLNVIRYEVDDEGKPIEETAVKISEIDEKDGKVVLHKGLKSLLIETPFDKKNFTQLAAHLQSGLVAPLPTLAPGFEYPEVKLHGIKQGKAAAPMGDMDGESDMDADGGMAPIFPGGGLPGAPQPGGQTGSEVKQVALAKLKKRNPDLVDKLLGKFNPFDPLGRLEPEKAVKTGFPGFPGMPMDPNMGGEEDPENGGAFVDEDDMNMEQPGMATGPRKGFPQTALVRFIDIDVQPGKTYTYFVQPVLSNPNYQKYKQVMYKELADQRVLPDKGSSWTKTPDITIPSKMEFYVVDQFELDPKRKPKNIPSWQREFTNEHKAAVQIHQWVKEFDTADDTFDVGTWAIAERLVIHRGEYIGRSEIPVPMLQWNKSKGQFDFAGKFERKRPTEYPQTNIDFLPGGEGPVMVDFKGGRRAPQSGLSAEDAAINMLVINPDGSLVRRSSRIDIDQRTNRGAEREERYEKWREMLEKTRKKMAPPPMPDGEGGFPGGFPGGGS